MALGVNLAMLVAGIGELKDCGTFSRVKGVRYIFQGVVSVSGWIPDATGPLSSPVSVIRRLAIIPDSAGSPTPEQPREPRKCTALLLQNGKNLTKAASY